MLLIIGNTDLTSSVQNEEYNVQIEPQYTEWTDANNTKHRTYFDSKAKGKIGIICGGANCISTEDFLNLLETHTENKKLTCTCYISNTSKMETLTCYYTLENNGFYDSNVNVFTLNLEEC